MTVSQLGQELRLDSGTLTPLLKRMESHGIVTRERTLEDEREVRISLTSNGRKLKKVTDRARDRVFQRLHMSLNDIEQLRAELMEIAERLEQPN